MFGNGHPPDWRKDVPLYTLSVKREFGARHFLTGGDWGDENKPHAHRYGVEVRLDGEELNEFGYLADIVEVEGSLDALLAELKDRTLNDLPAFNGRNPSIERLARYIFGRLAPQWAGKIRGLEVRVFEDQRAWAAFRGTRDALRTGPER